MDPALKEQITVKLRDYLKREPTEDEIVNGQTDANLRAWIAQDDAAVQKGVISAIAEAAKVDVASVEAQVKADIAAIDKLI